MYSQIFSNSILLVQYDHVHEYQYTSNIIIKVFYSVISCQKTFKKIYYILVRLFTSALCFIYLCIMFCVTVYLRILSFPFDVTFYRDGRKIFVNSCMIYTIKMNLVLMELFQKYKITEKVFQKIMLGYIKDDTRKRTHKQNI